MVIHPDVVETFTLNYKSQRSLGLILWETRCVPKCVQCKIYQFMDVFHWIHEEFDLLVAKVNLVFYPLGTVNM